MMELREFLVKAKITCYAAGGEATEKVLKDGCKELMYDADGFRYRDRYYGFDPFIGQEIVWKNGRLIWSMNYYGRLTSNIIPAKEVYGFLQKAMGLVKEDRPYRGPSKFKEGYFEYIDENTGDIEDFSGSEKILFKGQQIYTLEYRGGFVKSK